MESISAHGGLVNVYLKESTITGEGVRILIENLLKLMQLTTLTTASEFNQSTFLNTFKKKFIYQRLINMGDLVIKQSFNSTGGLHLKINYNLFSSELLQDNLPCGLWLY